MLYGQDILLPHRRQFEEIAHGHHHHTLALAELIVHLVTTSHHAGMMLQHFARENSVKMEAGGFTQYPDCAFRIMGSDGRAFNFVVELDCGTERVRTKQDVESIERKVRGYDVHQSQFAADDPQRYLVLFVTTRSTIRSQHILDLADMVMQNRQRTVFLATDLAGLMQTDPFVDAVFTDHRGLRRTLIPRSPNKSEQLDGMAQTLPDSR